MRDGAQKVFLANKSKLYKTLDKNQQNLKYYVLNFMYQKYLTPKKVGLKNKFLKKSQKIIKQKYVLTCHLKRMIRL